MQTLEQQILLACVAASPDFERLAFLLEKQPDWYELQRQGLRHGVLPLLYQSLKKCPGSPVPSPVLIQLQEQFASHALRSMQMQQELHRLVGLLCGEGIAVIPFKGPVLAEETYGDIALRSFVDLDLLVPPEQAQKAAQILLAKGYLLDFELPQDRWVGLQKVEYHLSLNHPEHDWIVEIHWALSHPMYMQSFDSSPCWQDLEGGRERRLKPEETLVMLCAHGTKHFWEQLKWLVDIDRMLRSGEPLNWNAAFSLARRSGSMRSLLLGLNLSQSLLETPLCTETSARIDGNDVVRSLNRAAIANLFRENPGLKSHKNQYVFYLQSRDTLSDQMRQILRWLFFPRRADWEVFPIGDYCHALYYVERPVRMAWKWLLRPMLPLLPGLGDAKSK